MQKSSNEAFKSPFVCQCPAPCTFLFCVAFAFSQIWGGKTFLINLTSILSDVSLVSFLVWGVEREKLSELKWEAPLCADISVYRQNKTKLKAFVCNHNSHVTSGTGLQCRAELDFFFFFFFGWTIGCLLEIKPCRICSFKVAMESFFTYCRYHLSWAAL